MSGNGLDELKVKQKMYEVLKEIGAPRDVLEYVLETGELPFVADDGTFVWHNRNGITMVRTKNKWVVIL